MNWFEIFKVASKPKPVWLEGVLKQMDDGFTYLDIPDSLIKPFIQMIPDEVVHPKELTDHYAGCHISVMDADDVKDKDIKEIGDTFAFQITGVEEVKPEGWKGVERVFFVVVDAPELEDLREKYDLSRLIKGHQFHITVGVVPR